MSLKSDKDLPPAIKSTWLKATSAYELKNYGYAIQLAQTVLKQVPDFLAARQLARRSAIAKNGAKKSGFFGGISAPSFSTMKVQGLLKKDPAAAMDAVEKILESEPYNAQANQLLKDSAVAMNLIDVAAFALETIVEGNPKDVKPLHELAKLYLTHDEPERAVEVYGKILAATPNDLGAIKGAKDAAAKASMKKGGWEKAEDYRDLLRDKETAEALEQQGRVVKDEDTINSLLVDLHQQVEQEPASVDKSRRIAELYEQKDDIDNAVAWYEYTSSLVNGADPTIARKLSDLGLKRIEAAIVARENYLSENGPDSDESRQYAAEIEDLRRQHAEYELEGAQSAVDRNPTDLAARYKLGEILLRAGHHGKAIPELQKALQNPHSRIKAMNLLAQCHMAMNMLDLAAKRLSDAASELSSMDGTKKEVVYNLGLVYEKMGQKEKSIECFKQIYEVDYGYKDVAARVESSYGN